MRWFAEINPDIIEYAHSEWKTVQKLNQYLKKKQILREQTHSKNTLVTFGKKNQITCTYKIM